MPRRRQMAGHFVLEVVIHPRTNLKRRIIKPVGLGKAKHHADLESERAGSSSLTEAGPQEGDATRLPYLVKTISLRIYARQ